MSNYRLIVGLGNPGPEYAGTRHNIGFRVLEHLGPVDSHWKVKNKSQYLETSVNSKPVTLIKPTTFMNLSGESVVAWANFFKLEPSQIVVVHDEIDLPFSRLRLAQAGGDGGHNGLKSIAQLLGSKDFIRLRVGVGRPFYKIPEASGVAADWVLGSFDAQEKAELPKLIERAAAALEELISSDLKTAQTKFNSRETV